MKRNKTDEKTFMSRLSINSIEDKGSISVYVIVTLVFLSIVLVSMLAASKNSVITSLKSRETIKNIYENDVASIDEIYSIEIVKNSGSSEPPELPEETEQTWTQDRTWVEDNNGMRLEVGSPVTGYNVTVGGKEYGNGKWYVLGAKSGKLLITTNENVETVTLSGTEGYVNGKAILNKEAAKYTNYDFTNETARAINVDDINSVTGYTKSEGSSFIYTKNSSDGRIYRDGTDTGQTFFRHWTRTGWKILDKGDSSAPIKSTNYTYYPQTNSTTYSNEANIDGSNSSYNLLFENTKDNIYWLATECVFNYDTLEAGFGFFEVNDGMVKCRSVPFSHGYANTSELGMRPVVTLDNSVKVTSTGGLTQSRSDGGTYTEQVQYWEQDQTIVRDTTYNFIFEVGGAISGYTANSISDWYVLGAENGKLLITSNSNNLTNVSLSDQNGYTGGMNVLNTTAANYVNSIYADSARVINIEDINKITGYIKPTFSNGIFSMSSNKIYYNGTGTNFSKFVYYKVDTNEWKTMVNGESYSLLNTSYSYYPQTNSSSPSTSSSINGSSNSYILLFQDTPEGKEYYVGPTCVTDFQSGLAGFGFFRVIDGYVSNKALYFSHRLWSYYKL